MKEIWLLHPTINRFEVSNLGKVRNSLTKKEYAQWKNKWGYKLVSLSTNGKNKHYQVHRLVLETFVRFSNLKTNHKDCNRENNTINNLEYMTQKDNVKYSYDVGNKLPPQNGKINFKQAEEIRQKIKLGEKQKYLAIEYNISPQLVCSINKNRCWVRDIKGEIENGIKF